MPRPQSRLPRILGAGVAAALLLSTLSCRADDAKIATASLRVAAPNAPSATLDLAALDRLPQRTVHATAHGRSLTCSGPALIDVLASVGVPRGDALRGKQLALYVRASAADGYRAVFALAELDPEFRAEVPIVAARCDGHALVTSDGPLRIVAPGDLRPARWVRQLTALDVLRAAD